jgi:anaerobic selenocysteine-containing dehydrogenase
MASLRKTLLWALCEAVQNRPDIQKRSNHVRYRSALEPRFRPHTSHWGVFSARMKNGRLGVRAYDKDPDPNRLIENFPDALAHRARIARPMARRGWLEPGAGCDDRRGRDEFVALSWDEALDRLGDELKRIRDRFGPKAVLAGPMAGPAPAVSITRKARFIASSILRSAATSGRSTPTVQAQPALSFRL